MQAGKAHFISFALVLAVVQGIALAQTDRAAGDSISGIYQGLAKMPPGSADINFVIEINSDHGTLSGHVEVEGGQLPLTGNYSRGTVTIKFKPGEEITITAKAAGDRITGAWAMEGGRTGAIEMKRVSSAWKQVHEMIVNAEAELRESAKAGPSAGDAIARTKKWADQLLRYTLQHPGAAESKDAEDEGLLLLLRAGLIAEAAARSVELNSSQETWHRVVMNQLQTAAGEKDYDYAIRNADTLIEHSKAPDLKAKIRLAQGEAYWQKAETPRAKTAFRTVIDEYPKTPSAKEAIGNIYEIEKLNVGQPAPPLTSQFVDGRQVKLADYKGKAVLLVFWASW